MGRPEDLTSGPASGREALLDRIERTTELPLMILSPAMIPLFAGLLIWEPGPVPRPVVLGLYVLVWAVFVADLAIKTAIAPERAQYLRRNWFDVLVAMFPAIRPLRVPLIIVYGSRVYGRRVRFAHVDFLAAYAIGLVLVIATIVTSVERGHDSPVDSFPDALWWAIATVTTVGYGDVVPVTAAGRAFAYVLMLGGIGLFAALTANLASMLTKREDPGIAAVASLAEEVRELRETLERMNGRDAPR